MLFYLFKPLNSFSTFAEVQPELELKVITFIAFSASGDMRVTTKCQVTLLPTVFTLRNFQVYVCTSNDSNVLSYIKITIDDILH